MKINRYFLKSFICLLALSLVNSAMASIKIAEAQKVNSKSDIAKYINDNSDKMLRSFTHVKANIVNDEKMQSLLFYDDENLYIYVKVQESLMDKLTTRSAGNDDTRIFNDDNFEFFIAPYNNIDDYYHMTVNSKGAKYEVFRIGTQVKTDWNPTWPVDVEKFDNGWSILAAIPFSAFDTEVNEMSNWRINICNTSMTTGQWVAHTWANVSRSFHQPSKFGVLVFDDNYENILKNGYIKSWENRLNKLEADLTNNKESYNTYNNEFQALKKDYQKQADKVAKLDKVNKEQLGECVSEILVEYEKLSLLENLVNSAIKKEVFVATLKEAKGKEIIAYSIAEPITADKVMELPELPKEMSNQINVVACPNEYEPASFVVIGLKEMNLEVDVEDLKGKNGTINSDNIDLRIVKRWYQSGSRNITNEGVRVLLPELLVKDASIIKIDSLKRDNFVKLTFPNGKTEYVNMSHNRKMVPKDFVCEKYPITDAKTLQPLPLKEGTVKQYWVTVKVPKDAKAGDYSGKILLKDGDKVIDNFVLNLTVLPFELEKNPLESSIYFHWGNSVYPDTKGSVCRQIRNLEQYRVELENLMAHGITNPTVGENLKLLPTILKMREEVGMSNDNLYLLSANSARVSRSDIKKHIKIAKEFGYKNIYLYGPDEARGDALRKKIPDFKTVQSLGGRNFFAGYIGNNFPILGELQDLLICAGVPQKEEAARWHSIGKKIFSYANPQIGVENPEIYRRNYGLVLEESDFDGAMNFMYYQTWNDFNQGLWRSHNFVYPTTDGVLDTIQYEGYREGIDDIRYLTTLRKAISDAEKNRNVSPETIAKAKKFEANIDLTANLYDIRKEMIELIISLKK